MKQYFFQLVFFFLFSTFSNAQVLNVENKRQIFENGLSGSIEFGLDYNRSKQTDWEFKMTSHLQWKREDWGVLLLNEINFDKGGDTEFSNEGYQHLRINRHLNKKYSFELFIQNQYDPIRDIANRRLAGVGGRYKLPHDNFLGISSFYEYEKMVDDDIFSTIRLSTYLNIQIQINSKFFIQNSFYFQPNSRNLLDYRVLEEFSLVFEISEKISCTNNFNILYDSEPPPGISKYIYRFENGFIYSF